MTRVDERKRATELKAPDVRELIKASLPAVLPQLNSALDHLQRVLDAAVINADVQKKWEELDRQAIKGKIVHSNDYLRDPAAVARRDQVLKQKVALQPGENAVLLDFHKLLTPDALKPTSDNPDEAAYLLLVVAEVFEHQGVWLVLDSSAGAMTQNLEPSNPQKWRVRLLLGYKPGALVEQIETSTGSLNRKALLSVTKLGAAYWKFVEKGPTLTALRAALDRVSFQITNGRNEHWWWSIHRTDFYVVSKVSDKLGAATWRNESTWEQPHQAYVKALHLIAAGKLMEAAKYAQIAAILAESCARALHEYIDATTSGASRAVKILEVAQTCGKIAQFILDVITIGKGLLHLLSRKATTRALEAGAQRQLGSGGQRLLPAAGESTRTPVPNTPRVPTQGGGIAKQGTLVETAIPVKPRAVRPVSGSKTDIGEAVDNVRRELGLPPRVETFEERLVMAEVIERDNQYRAWQRLNIDASLAEKYAAYDRIMGPYQYAF